MLTGLTLNSDHVSQINAQHWLTTLPYYPSNFTVLLSEMLSQRLSHQTSQTPPNHSIILCFFKKVGKSYAVVAHREAQNHMPM